MENFFLNIDFDLDQQFTSQINFILHTLPEKEYVKELFRLKEQFNKERTVDPEKRIKIKQNLDKMKDNANSIVMVVEEGYLKEVGGNVRIDSKKLFKRKVSTEYNICEDTSFGKEQSAFAKGTGFFIKENMVATAAHVIIEAGYDIKKYRFINNVIKENSDDFENDIMVPKSQIWKPVGNNPKIPSNQYEYFSKGSDWLILEVEPAYPDTVNIPPYIVKFDNNRSPTEDDELYSLGHGLGLPTKVSYEGKIQKVYTNKNFFECNLTLLGGNSGSPVFYADNHELAGIYMRGVKKLQIREKNGEKECLIVKDTTTPFEGQECQILDNVINALNNL